MKNRKTIHKWTEELTPAEIIIMEEYAKAEMLGLADEISPTEAINLEQKTD